MEKDRINELLSKEILTKNECREVLREFGDYIKGRYGCFCKTTDRKMLTNEFHKIVEENNLNG